jgi:carboxyl-terminal processing protease
MKRIILWMVFLLMAGTPIKAQEEQDHNFEVAKNLEIFNALYRHLDMLYVDTLDANRMVETGIRAMLQRLDPYTVYYPKASDLKSFITGKYGGIGALIRYHMKQKTTVIDEPMEDTPAQEAGLQKGDIILSIDDTTMVGKSVDYVREHLRGEAGTTFALKIRRPSTNKVMQMKITRKTLSATPTIPYYGMQGDGIGYICLTQFTEGCAQEVRRAFLDLKKQGMRSLVLDLRGNGGGSELEAAQLVNIFVPRGITVASNKGKLRRANHDYTTTVEPIDTVMPLVVLVNDDTASSSEITSGALQDLDRAVIVGTRTYGKGLVQMPVDLPHNAQLKVTTSRYYIPSGRCIQAINYKQGEGTYQEHIPDSLTKVFHTANGREVRDGGGITPDLIVKPDSLPNIAYYLGTSGRDSTETMFEYELDYLAKHPTIAPVSEFEITDADYEEFKQRAIASGFTYDPESNRAMKALKKIMEFEGYFEEAKPEFEALEKKLLHDLSHDLDLHKETLKRMIASDIVAAHYYQRGTVEYSLKHDKQMEAARELLRDETKYRQLLEPK